MPEPKKLDPKLVKLLSSLTLQPGDVLLRSVRFQRSVHFRSKDRNLAAEHVDQADLEDVAVVLRGGAVVLDHQGDWEDTEVPLTNVACYVRMPSFEPEGDLVKANCSRCGEVLDHAHDEVKPLCSTCNPGALQPSVLDANPHMLPLGESLSTRSGELMSLGPPRTPEESKLIADAAAANFADIVKANETRDALVTVAPPAVSNEPKLTKAQRRAQRKAAK